MAVELVTRVPIMGVGLSKEIIGLYDTEDSTYYRMLDGNNHILRAEKYQDMVCVSRTILRQVAQLGCKRFFFTVVNFTPKPWSVVKKDKFSCITPLQKFLENRQEIHFEGTRYGDEQFGVCLRKWDIIDFNQTVIPH